MKKTNYTHEEIMKDIPNKGFFGHPKGLSTLFFTEFWERFSYYGMKAILIYYLYYTVADGGFALPQSVAMQIVAIYGTLIYMSGIIGGLDCRPNYWYPKCGLLRWIPHHDWPYFTVITE